MTTKRPEKPLIVGIDPGFYGAVAAINVETKNSSVQDMPLRADKNGRKHLALPLLAKVLHDLGPARIAIAVIEDVGPRPREGVSSVFRFGFGAGALHGMLAGMGIVVLAVPPAVWKAKLCVGDKASSIKKARDLFPEQAALGFLDLKKNDGRAEALLLAHYGARLVP